MSKRKGKRAHSEMHMLSTKKFRDELLGGQQDYDENLLAESSDDSDDNEALLKDDDEDDEDEEEEANVKVKEGGKAKEEDGLPRQSPKKLLRTSNIFLRNSKICFRNS